VSRIQRAPGKGHFVPLALRSCAIDTSGPSPGDRALHLRVARKPDDDAAASPRGTAMSTLPAKSMRRAVHTRRLGVEGLRKARVPAHTPREPDARTGLRAATIPSRARDPR